MLYCTHGDAIGDAKEENYRDAATLGTGCAVFGHLRTFLMGITMHILHRLALFGCVAVLLAGRAAGAAETPPKLRVLIFSGQNNHDWRKTTPVLKQILAQRPGSRWR